jgi:hypothetical protein
MLIYALRGPKPHASFRVERIFLGMISGREKEGRSGVYAGTFLDGFGSSTIWNLNRVAFIWTARYPKLQYVFRPATCTLPALQ